MASSFQVSGMVSGIDSKTMISQLMSIESQPLTQLEDKVSANSKKITAIQDLNTQLLSLKKVMDTLQDKDTYNATSSTSSNSSVVSITSNTDASAGTYKLTKISQLATATVMKTNSTNNGGGLGGSIDVDATLSEAGFGTTPTNGTDSDGIANTSGSFSINGTSIEYNVNTDSLQDILDKINSSSAGVTASYDSNTDKVSLTRDSGTDTISLSSGSDKGNLLKVLHLTDATQSGSPMSVTSSVHLKTVNTGEYLTSEKSNFGTAVTAGTFTINGEEITLTDSDTLKTIMSKINSSDAGVKASYDSTSDKLVLTSKNTGSTSINVGATSDTSNFLSAAFITNSTASTTAGKNAIFEIEGINDGNPITRMSNTIDDVITGSTITLSDTYNTDAADPEDPISLSISSSTSAASTAINDFVSKFNAVVSSIKVKTSSATYSNNEKTGEAGPLNGDATITGIRTYLQLQSTGLISGLPKEFNSLEDLGITLNDSGELEVDSTKLNNALNDNMSSVYNIFSNSTNGLSNTLETYLDGLTDTASGSMTRISNDLTSYDKIINDQITSFQDRLDSMEERLSKQFAGIEEAYAKMQSQATILSQLGSMSSSYSLST